jgi:hypothetical protein
VSGRSGSASPCAWTRCLRGRACRHDHLTVRYSRCSLRRRPGAARAKESINEGTRLPEQTSFAAPLCLLVRRRYGLSYDLAGSSREGVRLDGRNTERFAPGRRLGTILLPCRFSGCGFFFMVAECGNWDTVPSQGRSRSSSSQCPSGHIWRKFDPRGDAGHRTWRGRPCVRDCEEDYRACACR